MGGFNMSSKLLCFLIVLFILPFFLSAQTWKNTVDLNLTVDDQDRIDIYTNADGNNIILQTSSQLKYYLFSYSGTQVRTVTLDNNISEYPRLSCISGYQDTVIVLWKEGTYIHAKRTTDAGLNWTNLTSNELDYVYSNGLEVWPTEDELHVVWSESDSDEDGYYETYHRPLKYNGTWGTKKQVTDYSGEEGGFPSVTTSANRVHVAYTECYSTDPVGNRGTSKNRDKYNTSWQTPLEIFNDAGRSYVVATSQKLHAFYYDFAPGMGQFGYNLYHCYRNFTSSSWSTPYLILSYGADLDVNTVDMAVTSNDSLHIVYNGEYYKEYTGSWQSTYDYSTGSKNYNQKISANSNDIYVIWIQNKDQAYTLMLKQRDYVPLAPQKLYVDFYVGDHPTVHWDANREADLKGYHVYRAIPKISENKRLTTNTITATYYVDYDYLEGETYQAYYYARAVDQYDNLSPSSNSYGVWVMPTKQGQLSQTETLYPARFELGQNYPNPFNPATTIAFDLPSDVKVRVQIFDIAGRLICTLVDEPKKAGSHQVIWNGQDNHGNSVASGVYVYRLQAGDFVQSRKMLFMK